MATTSSAVEIVSVQPIRGLLSVERLDQESSERVDLSVRTNLSAGQAIEMLRVSYKKNGDVYSVDTPIAISSQSNVRFLPSMLDIIGGIAVVPIKAIFTGKDVPESEADLEFIGIAIDGTHITTEVLRFETRRVSERVYATHVEILDPAPKIKNIVLRFRGQEFVCPLRYGE